MGVYNTSSLLLMVNFFPLLQDFEADPELKKGVKDLLEEMVCNTNLLPAEHKAAASILRVLTKDDDVQKTKVDLDELLRPPTVSHLTHCLFVMCFEENMAYICGGWFSSSTATRQQLWNLTIRVFSTVRFRQLCVLKQPIDRFQCNQFDFLWRFTWKPEVVA